VGSSLGFGQEKQEFLPHIELTSEGFWGGEGGKRSYCTTAGPAQFFVFAHTDVVVFYH